MGDVSGRGAFRRRAPGARRQSRAGDQLVAYLAQQAQAPRGRSHPASPRTASPLRLVRRSTA